MPYRLTALSREEDYSGFCHLAARLTRILEVPFNEGGFELVKRWERGIQFYSQTMSQLRPGPNLILLFQSMIIQCLS